MNRYMIEFFANIKNSFFSPQFYVEAREKSLFRAYGFLYWSALLAASVLVLAFAVSLVPSALNHTPLKTVEEKFPDTLTVAVVDGKASANVEMPYKVPVQDNDTIQDFDNYLVIDTRPDVTVSTLESYKSVAVLTEKSLYIHQGEGEARVIPLSDSEDITVDKEFAREAAEGLLNVFWIVLPFFIVLAAPLLALLALVYHAIASLAGAFIALGIGKIRGVTMTYGEAYVTALYGSVPILLIGTAWLMLGIGGMPPFLDVLVFAFLLALNLNPNTKNPAVAG